MYKGRCFQFNHDKQEQSQTFSYQSCNLLISCLKSERQHNKQCLELFDQGAVKFENTWKTQDQGCI